MVRKEIRDIRDQKGWTASKKGAKAQRGVIRGVQGLNELPGGNWENVEEVKIAWKEEPAWGTQGRKQIVLEIKS